MRKAKGQNNNSGTRHSSASLNITLPTNAWSVSEGRPGWSSASGNTPPLWVIGDTSVANKLKN